MKKLLSMGCAVAVGCGWLGITTISQSQTAGAASPSISYQMTKIGAGHYTVKIRDGYVDTVCAFSVGTPTLDLIGGIESTTIFACAPGVISLAPNGGIQHYWPCSVRPSLCSNTWAWDRDSLYRGSIYDYGKLIDSSSWVVYHTCVATANRHYWWYRALFFPIIADEGGVTTDLPPVASNEKEIKC
jgi:hypothetical protein